MSNGKHVMVFCPLLNLGDRTPEEFGDLWGLNVKVYGPAFGPSYLLLSRGTSFFESPEEINDLSQPLMYKVRNIYYNKPPGK
jgi:hypothetical protein